MKFSIISRFGRTDARRGGGIYKTAKLTSTMLKDKGIEVSEVVDKASSFDLKDTDAIWVYCADYQDILENILDKVDSTHIPVIINSGWIPGVGRENWMREVIDRFSTKFPNLFFSVFSRKAVSILNETGFEGRVVFLPHLQKISARTISQPHDERKGLCIGELGKLSRSSLSSYNVNLFLDKLFSSDFSEEVYAYGQYSSDKGFLGKFSDRVILIEKLEQKQFFDRLSKMKYFLWLTDKETFAAPPIEIASFGVVPILPEMPQSLSEYLPNALFYSNEDSAVSHLINSISSDNYTEICNAVLDDIDRLSLSNLADIFHNQLSVIIKQSRS